MAANRVVLIHSAGEESVVEAVQMLLKRIGADIEWVRPTAPPFADEGWTDTQWVEVSDLIKDTGLALAGALGAAEGWQERSPHVELRERCGCFAGIRPIKGLRGLPARVPDLDVVVIRETTEDVYAGHEHELMPGGVATLKTVTRAATERIAHYAFDYARRHARKRITIIHKANIMKETDGLFLRTCRSIAEQYPDIEVDDLIVDNASMQMVLRPERYDVLLCGNLYGDILSALAAGLVGGTSAKAGVAVGEDLRIFESLSHFGTDEHDADTLNPLPLLLPAMRLVNYIGQREGARRLRSAVQDVLVDGRFNTPDLGGTATTLAMADAIAEHL